MIVRPRCATVVALLVLSACSPSLNWRQVPVAQLSALLPCKPDHAERHVDILGVQQPLAMWGCEANGALFAVSQTRVPVGTPPEALIRAWQAAAKSNIRTRQSKVLSFKPPVLVKAESAHGVMVHLVGQQANGQAVQAQLAWFSANGVIYHLAVYGPSLTPAMLEPFFTEMHWL